MAFGFIYKTTNTINGKGYIGMCSSPSRFNTYLGSGKLLTHAIEKYGKDKFTRDILEWCDTDEQLRMAEAKWIEHYNAVESNEFYNLHDGGRGGDTGFHVSMSEVVKSTWDKYTEEQRKARGNATSAGKKGKGTSTDNSMYGRSIVKEKNLKWYNNGIKAIYVSEGTQPEGFVRGRKLNG